MIFSATAVFCEDVREEKSGQHTIIGVFSDNLNFHVQKRSSNDHSATAVAIPKFAAYVRVVINVEEKASPLAAVLSMPDGTEHELGSFDAEAIERTQAAAQAKGSPIAGFIFKALISPLPIDRSGIVSVHIRTDKEDRVVGILNAAIITNDSA